MGTPLPPIDTEPGIECLICPETGQPFLGGPTPLNPRMSFTDFSQGALWLAAYEDELTTEQELLQLPGGCGWLFVGTFFTWFWDWSAGFADIRLNLITNPAELAFFHAPGLICKVEYANLLVAAPGVIAFDGKCNLYW